MKNTIAPNLQTDGYSMYTANDISNNLKSGYYNNSIGQFVAVDYDEAARYAEQGGLALASWENPNQNKSGHIGVLTGGYGGDGLATMENLNIFQTGTKDRYGEMIYFDGFEHAQSQFYIWVK